MAIVPPLAALGVLLAHATAGAQSQSDEERGAGITGLPVAAYLPESGFILGGYGLYYFHFAGQRSIDPVSTLPVLAAVTTQGELGVEFTPELFWEGERVWLVADVTVRRQPETSFYGIGNDTRQDDEETYRKTVLGLDIEQRLKLVSGLYVGLAYSLHWRGVGEVQPGGVLDTLDPAGRSGGWTSGLGPTLTWDDRDTNHAPHRGALARLSAVHHDRLLASEWSFVRLELDARQYIPVWREHVLAVRVVAQQVVGTAPFDRLAELGGSVLTRGYIRGRFRDETLLNVQLEYRLPLLWRFGAAVFASAGQVASHPGALGLTDFHVSAGIGLRFALVPEERVNMRLDLAFSPDRVLPYFAPLEAF